MLVSLRKLMSQKGAALVEYAVLLAFVCVIGWALLGGSGLQSGVKNTVTNASSMLTSAGNLSSKPNS